MALWQWSTTPANNANVGNIDWAPNMPPSAVNPSARQMMADVAAWYASPEWLPTGLMPTYVSTTSFTLTGNQTAIYTVGRRVRTFNTGGTFYGTISASAFTSVTTVTLTMDGTGVLDSGLSEVDVGIMNPTNPSLGTLSILNLSGAPLSNQIGTLNMSAVNAGVEMGSQSQSNTPFIDFHSSGNAIDYDVRVIASGGNSSVGQGTLNIYAASGLTCNGNITAYSDERLKKDWAPLPPDFIEHLAALRRGTFTRVDTGERQVGVGAQSLQTFMPEAVQGDGLLSVAYGQAALVAVAELAAEVLRLRAMLEPLK
jgi:hypothetical protein